MRNYLSCNDNFMECGNINISFIVCEASISIEINPRDPQSYFFLSSEFLILKRPSTGFPHSKHVHGLYVVIQHQMCLSRNHQS